MWKLKTIARNPNSESYFWTGRVHHHLHSLVLGKGNQNLLVSFSSHKYSHVYLDDCRIEDRVEFRLFTVFQDHMTQNVPFFSFQLTRMRKWSSVDVSPRFWYLRWLLLLLSRWLRCPLPRERPDLPPRSPRPRTPLSTITRESFEFYIYSSFYI